MAWTTEDTWVLPTPLRTQPLVSQRQIHMQTVKPYGHVKHWEYCERVGCMHGFSAAHACAQCVNWVASLVG